MKKRISIAVLAAVATTICVFLKYQARIPTPPLNTIGAYLVIPAVLLLMKPFPIKDYTAAIVFYIFASPLGSILNFYRLIPSYDRIVHFASGILAAELGYMLLVWLFDKYKVEKNKIILLLFAVTISCSCAALWEIYEFTGDTLLAMSMQGNNLNTMGDIISGVLGGITYGFCSWGIWKRKSTNIRGLAAKQ